MFFHTKGPGARNGEPLLTGGLRTDGFMLGSWSDHARNRPRTVHDVSAVLSKFILDFTLDLIMSFFVAGAAFGDVGG